MGEVYRAVDTTLRRAVAIKVLSPRFTADPEHLARLEREAQLLASLNHPHIAAIYGLEEHAGQKLLVMELAEGETLADRLRAGPLPLEEALEIAIQLADAVSAAHESGIIHRDLKPANVIVTPQAGIKVLDFGLAKSLGPVHRRTGTSSAPDDDLDTGSTFIRAASGVGMIVGTPAYMSPEQARGSPVDRRTDVWAFGVILWELITGRRLFGGDSISDTLAEVLKVEPDWSALTGDVPPALRRLLRRCLQKNPRDRQRDLADVRLELQEVASAPPEPAGVRTPPRPSRWGYAAGAAGLALFAAAAAIVLPSSTGVAPPPRVAAFAIAAPPQGAFSSVPALSPDGRRVAFVAPGASGSDVIWLRPLDAIEARPIAGTEGAYHPFWSPDGDAIGFFSARELKTVTLAGTVRTVCSGIQGLAGGSWSRKGFILYADNNGLFTVAASGGAPRPVPALPGKEKALALWPHLLPDGEHFLAKLWAAGAGGGLYVGSVSAPDRKLLIDSEGIADIGRAEFDGESHLVYEEEGALYARAFDPRRHEFRSESVRIAPRVFASGGRESRFSVRSGGLLVYQEESYPRSQLTWVDRQGARVGTMGRVERITDFALSPDGSWVAVQNVDERIPALFLFGTSREHIVRLTTDWPSMQPVWSPDSKQLAFSQARNGPPAPVVISIDTPQKVRSLAAPGDLMMPTSWSSDGRLLLSRLGGEKTKSDLLVTPAAGGAIEPLVSSAFDEYSGAISPDGVWVAFASNESGADEVYVLRFEEPGRRWQVSAGGGTSPQWSRDGKELFYAGGSRQRMLTAVKFDPGEEPSLGAPVPLFALEHSAYDVASDGRFLVLRSTGDDGHAPLVAITDWRAQLGVR